MNDDKHIWAELYWREIECRHALYWKSLYLWGGGALLTLLAPFIRPETKQLGNAVFIFPIFGFIIAIVGAWHLAAEAERLAVVSQKYNDLRGEQLPTWPYQGHRSFYQQAVSESIRDAVTVLYLFGFSVLSIVSGLFLLIVKYPEAWTLLLGTSVLILVAAGFFMFSILARNRRRHNQSVRPERQRTGG